MSGFTKDVHAPLDVQVADENGVWIIILKVYITVQTSIVLKDIFNHLTAQNV
jgi:hypothetical protein